MQYTVNTYFAILLITIAGSVATMIIVRAADAPTTFATSGSEGAYIQLQESILDN